MASKKKQPIRIANNIQKRMTGGTDDEICCSTRKSLNEVLENSCSIPCEDGNLTNHNQQGSQDDQTYTASTLDSLRAQIDSEFNTMYSSAGSLLGKDVSSKRMGVGNGPMCFCTPKSSGPPGGKKVDEMIDYTMKNLNEAGKALINLGDNFEQDLKLMFMDIMGRVQHWVSVVQNRICAASADLELLRKVSIAGVSDLITEKELELVELRKKLAEAEALLASKEKEPEVTRKALSNLIAGNERTSTSAQSDPENGTAIVLVDTASQSVEDGEKEKADREAELEEELAQLRVENERLLEERTEYENSVQCALLRGISSLNVEAFKVLRCPPIPCCTPCAYSPPCSISQEPIVVSCHPRNPSKKLDAVPKPAQRGSKAVPRSEKTDNKTKSRNGAGINICSQQHSEHLLNFNEGDKRSSDNGVVLLLHHGDTGNLCRPCPKPQTYGSTSNRDNICVGGKCRKTVASSRDRVSGPRRSCGSRPESSDIYIRNRDETGENGTAKRNAVTAAKRCGAFDTNNRCNREDR